MRFRMECPRCGKNYITAYGHGTSDHRPYPTFNCGDCLMQDVEIVKMIATPYRPIRQSIRQMHAGDDEADGHKPPAWWRYTKR